MSDQMTAAVSTGKPAKEAAVRPGLESLLLHHEIEQFYYREAALLDDRRYNEWLDLFTEDATYWMPVRRTKTTKELDTEFAPRGAIAFFDDNKMLLSMRVKKLETGYSWAEDPPSRQRHIITNIRVVSQEGEEFAVHSNFHVYRTRLNSEETSWIGHREDRLRRVGETLRIASRSIFLEQTVLLSRNLSNFF
jgi:3-phenylpropionate/cinnamic acid dioxygenase small subunit